MARSVFLLLAGLVLVPATARAQDTASEPVRAERLRQLIELRFGERIREELGLTDEQASKVRGIVGSHTARRRGMELDDQRVRRELRQQLRPGVAANQEVVGKLLEKLGAGRVAFAQSFQEEVRELSAVLTPSQVGQFVLLRDQLYQRAQLIKQNRAAGQAVRP